MSSFILSIFLSCAFSSSIFSSFLAFSEIFSQRTRLIPILDLAHALCSLLNELTCELFLYGFESMCLGNSTLDTTACMSYRKLQFENWKIQAQNTLKHKKIQLWKNQDYEPANLLLVSCFFFSGSFLSYFSTPLISTNFTLLRTSLKYYFLTSTLGASFFSSHLFHLLHQSNTIVFINC